MLNKVLVLSCAAILMMFFFFTSEEPDQGTTPSGKQNLSRRSTNVVMVERSLATGKIFQVRAREVVEGGNQVARFRDFRMEQDGGPQFSGADASYDRKTSVLTIHGPVHIETAGGGRARIDDLRWDRMKSTASTDKPVRLEDEGSIITADRASFSEGFTNIALTGRVHAKIMRNILDL